MSTQTSFTTPEERTQELLERAHRQELHKNKTLIAVSGGLDSCIAADVICRYGPEYGFSPDAIVHIDTGCSVPQSRLAAKQMAERHGLDFIVQGYRKQSDSIAERILDNGWPGGYAGSPATGGHGLEWANRKDKPMNAVYMMFEGTQTWISGVRKLESKKRQGNVADSGINKDKPRRTWLAPIVGWTSQEKEEYVLKHNIPVSEAYLILGFSAECVACAFDNQDLLMEIDLLCPELSHAIRSLTLMLYQKIMRAELELAPKRLCWGWNTEEARTESQTDSQEILGCTKASCAEKNAPGWIRELNDHQVVSRQDVLTHWEEKGKI